jgi:hypothetical protein
VAPPSVEVVTKATNPVSERIPDPNAKTVATYEATAENSR